MTARWFVKSSWNKKDLNYITAPPFWWGFLLLAAENKTPEMTSLRFVLFPDDFSTFSLLCLLEINMLQSLLSNLSNFIWRKSGWNNMNAPCLYYGSSYVYIEISLTLFLRKLVWNIMKACWKAKVDSLLHQNRV